MGGRALIARFLAALEVLVQARARARLERALRELGGAPRRRPRPRIPAHPTQSQRPAPPAPPAPTLPTSAAELLGPPLPEPARAPTAVEVLAEIEQEEIEIACLVLARTKHTRTLAAKRLTRDERRAAALVVSPDVERPRTRGDCIDQPRPCPWVGCKYHLYLDVHPVTGALKLNHPELDPWELKESCALDVADRGSHTLEDVAALLAVHRQRIAQIEEGALERARPAAGRAA